MNLWMRNVLLTGHKGFIGSIKRAHGFIWSKYNGLQAELFYNVPI